MREDIASILLSEEQIHTRVRELGAEISRDYAGKEPLFVGVLKGCFIFMADLFREVTIPGSVDFMAVSSYGNGTSTTGAVKINKDLSQDIENRDVIIVEDILDSGVTLSYLTKYLQNRKPSSICIATLLDKPAPPRRCAGKVRRLYRAGRLRRRIRSGLCGEIPQSPVYRHSQAGYLRINL